jgi:hypothetical protein
MRDAVRQLVEKPGLILSDSAPIEAVEWAEELIASFERPAQNDEAVALLELLSRGDETSCFGLNGTILHFIETAPSWPIWPALKDAQGAWPERLRDRLANAGQYPPE